MAALRPLWDPELWCSNSILLHEYFYFHFHLLHYFVVAHVSSSRGRQKRELPKVEDKFIVEI